MCGRVVEAEQVQHGGVEIPDGCAFGLSAGLPGTKARPVSPPSSIPPRLSSRRPPNRVAMLATWQA